MARGDGPLRRRQARPALRAWSWSSSPTCSPATEFKAFAGAAAIKGIRVPGAADEYGRNQLDELTDRAKQLGAKGLVWLKVAADGSFESPVAKFLVGRRAGRGRRARSAPSPATCADRRRRVDDDVRGARPAAQRPRPAAGARGPVPLRVGRRLPDVRRRRRATGRPKPGHHPFTHAPPRRRRPARDRPDGRALAGLRPRAQRLGARLGLDPDPRARAAAAGLRRRSASPTRRPTASSASSSTRSTTAPRRTAGSPSASTGWSPSSPARRTSAR